MNSLAELQKKKGSLSGKHRTYWRGHGRRGGGGTLSFLELLSKVVVQLLMGTCGQSQLGSKLTKYSHTYQPPVTI